MTVIAPLGTLVGPKEFVIEAIGVEPLELQASAGGDSGGERLYGAISIVSSGKQDGEVPLILSPGVTITGTLHGEGVKPGRNDPLWTVIAKDVTVQYRSTTYEPLRTPPPAAVNRENGSWRLDGVIPSPLRIDVTGLPPGYVVTAMSHNGADVPIGHADVGYGALSHSIDITVAQVANSISGTVTKDGVPVPEAVVCLQREPVPQSIVGWQERGVTTDERGRYSATSLAPGAYRVCAMSPEGSFEALWTCLASIDSKRIEIGKTTNTTINLTVP